MMQNTVNQPFSIQKEMKIKKFTVLIAFFSIILYFADVISDILLAVNYYHNSHLTYFYMTLFLVILSAIVSSVFSLYMYCSDNEKEGFQASVKVWKFRTLFLVLGIAPVLRNVDALHFAWKGHRCRKDAEKRIYTRRMIYEITDSSFLQLVEAFLESGPQLVLQLYIFLKIRSWETNSFTATELWQLSSMIISIISISCSVVGYCNSLRNSLDHKNEFKWPLLVLLFLWRFFEIISRIIPMGLVIAATPYSCSIFVAHFITMTVWIYFMKTDFCDNRYAEKFFIILMGIISTFVFINPEDSPTRNRHVLFYGSTFMEDLAMMAIWLYICSPTLRIQIPALVTQLLSFFLSILIMVIYYKCFHPTIGKLSKKRVLENVPLNNTCKNVVQNEEADSMLQNDITVEADNTHENVLNGKVDSVLQNGVIVEANNTHENVVQNEQANTMLQNGVTVEADNTHENVVQNKQAITMFQNGVTVEADNTND